MRKVLGANVFTPLWTERELVRCTSSLTVSIGFVTKDVRAIAAAVVIGERLIWQGVAGSTLVQVVISASQGGTRSGTLPTWMTSNTVAWVAGVGAVLGLTTVARREPRGLGVGTRLHGIPRASVLPLVGRRRAASRSVGGLWRRRRRSNHGGRSRAAGSHFLH